MLGKPIARSKKKTAPAAAILPPPGLSDIRLSDIRLSDIRLSDVKLSDVKLSDGKRGERGRLGLFGVAGGKG